MNNPLMPPQHADAASFLRSIIEKSGLAANRGHPLYAYRCSAEDFTILERILRDASSDRPDGHFNDVQCACFCLYVAEWWRRKYIGGTWKWELILASIGLKDISRKALERLVTRGLIWWRRPLLRIGIRTGYLVTLACEGGLPLSLLEREGTRLRNYFRVLLRDVYIFQDTNARELSERHANHLPLSFHQVSVFEMSAQLVVAVWKLRQIAGSDANPIACLDAKEPGWRDLVPVNTGDEVASALIRGLLDDAVAVQAEPRPIITVITALIREQNGFTLIREIDAPPVARIVDVAAALGVLWDAIPRHFEFCYESPGGEELPIILVHSGAGGESGSARVEPFGRPFRRTGAQALDAVRIIAVRKGRRFAEVTVRGGAPLVDVPWIFAASSPEEPDRLQIIGYGGASLRKTEAFVAVSETASVQCDAPGEAEYVGSIAGVDRRVFRIRGKATITIDEETHYRVATAQPEDDTFEYHVEGPRLALAHSDTEIWLGLPGLVEQRGRSLRIAVASRELQWRPWGVKAHWRSLSADSVGSCVGTVEVRYAPRGVERFRARWKVLPSSARISVIPRERGHGEIVCRGLGRCDAGTLPISVERRDGPGGETTLVFRSEDVIPERVDTHLDFGGGRRVSFDLPYPSRDVRFIGRDGRPLDNGATIWVEQLTGVRAQVLEATTHGDFYVEGTLRARTGFPKPLTLDEELIEVAPGRYELDLRVLVDSIRVLLGATNDLDALVRLQIGNHGGARLPPRFLNIAHYDAKMRPMGFGAMIDSPDQARLGESINALRLEARPMSDPTAQPELLVSVASGHWSFVPPPGASGPWLITAWEGAISRVRPLRITLPDLAVDSNRKSRPAGELRFDDAGRLAGTQQILDALVAIIRRIAVNPDDEEWTVVECHLDTLGSLPATTFYLITKLVEDPDAMALALLRTSNPVKMQTIWRAIETLPCLFSLIPVRAWVRAARRWQDSIRRACVNADLDAKQYLHNLFEVFFQKAPALSPVLGVIVDALAFSFPDTPEVKERPLRLAGSSRDVGQVRKRIEDARQALLRAHANPRENADHWWPTGELPYDAFSQELAGVRLNNLWPSSDGSPHRESILNAPVIAACATTFDSVRLDAAQRFQLIKMRTFDPSWFDEAHAAYASLLIADQISQNRRYLDDAVD